MHSTIPLRRTALRILAVIGMVFAIVTLARLWSGGYLDRDPLWRFPARGRPAPVSVLLFSGDAGMRWGAGPYIAHALSADGIATTAIASSTAFRFGTSRAELDAIVAHAVARAARQAGGRRLVVIGQSYGADVLQTGLAHLPLPLRHRIAAVILIVPGTDTYFRADPLGWLYYLRPDSISATTIGRIDWTPVTCIYGAAERDSACPLLRRRNATVIALPGGHYLNHDRPRLLAALMPTIVRAARP